MTYNLTFSNRYVEAVVAAIQEHQSQLSTQQRDIFSVRLLLSIDRSRPEDALEVVAIADKFMHSNASYRVVVGVDVGGNPLKGTWAQLKPTLDSARQLKIPVTLHCGEVSNDSEVFEMIAYGPSRLGHALVLNDSHQRLILGAPNCCVEVCPSSNVKTLGLSSLDEHPTARTWLRHKHPVAISTDDSGVFSCSSSSEHFLFARTFGIEISELAAIVCQATRHSFLPSGTSKSLEESLRARASRLVWLDRTSLGCY
jgi:adenosine deaminase